MSVLQPNCIPPVSMVMSRGSSRSSRESSRGRSRSRRCSPCAVEAPGNPRTSESFYYAIPSPVVGPPREIYSSSPESRFSSSSSSSGRRSHQGSPTYDSYLNMVLVPIGEPSEKDIRRPTCTIPVLPKPPQTYSESGGGGGRRSRTRSISPSTRSITPPACSASPLAVPPEILPARSHIIIQPTWSDRSRSRSRTRPRTRSSSRSVSPRGYPQVIHPGWPHAAVSHPRYYFQDGNVTLEIDRTRYKIHRHFLVTNSPVFAKELPPYIIYTTLTGNVDKQAFELVLSLFYPKDCFSGHDIKSEPDWRKVLVFACQYKMTVIRDMALTKVPTLDPVEKVELATKYGLKDWLVSAYVDLCMKDLGDRNGWSAEEGKKIGLEGVLALADVRRDILEHLEEHLDRDKVLKTVEKKVEALKQI